MILRFADSFFNQLKDLRQYALISILMTAFLIDSWVVNNKFFEILIRKLLSNLVLAFLNLPKTSEVETDGT